MDALQGLFKHERSAGFIGVAGALLHLTLPISEAILNEVLQDGLMIECRVELQPGNRVGVAFPAPWWLPFKSVLLSIHEDLVLRPAPVVRLRLLSPKMLTGGMAAAVAKALGLLPAALRIDGGDIEIDLAGALRNLGHGDLLALLHAARIEIADGRMTLQLAVKVPDPQSPRRPSREEGRIE